MHAGYVDMCVAVCSYGWLQPPPQALRFSHGREASAKRVTGDEPQETMGRVLSTSRLPLRARFKERRLGTRQGWLCVEK